MALILSWKSSRAKTFSRTYHSYDRGLYNQNQLYGNTVTCEEILIIDLFVQLAKDMSVAAVRTIRKEIKELYINIQSLQEKDKACGNGSGIM